MKMFLKNTNEQILGEIVCTFETDDKTNFIVLTDNSRNEQGLLNVTAYYYEIIDNNMCLVPINDDDLPLVDEAIDRLKGKYN